MRPEQILLRVAGRTALRRQLGIVEKAPRARIGAGEQVLVRPVEVEQACDGTPDGRIPEYGTTRVHHHAVHAGRQAGPERIPDHAPVADGREVVAGCPARSGRFDLDVDDALLEGLEERVRVAEIVDPDLVVVVEAPLGWLVACPVFGVFA